MDCVQGALKNSVIPNNNYQQHSLSDEFSPVNVLPSDDFFVDGLLDFSDDGDFEEQKEDTNVVCDAVSDKPISVTPVVTENNDCFTIPVCKKKCFVINLYKNEIFKVLFYFIFFGFAG